MNLKTTPEERTAYRAGLLNRIKDAKRRKIEIELPRLQFQLAVLGDLEAFIAVYSGHSTFIGSSDYLLGERNET